MKWSTFKHKLEIKKMFALIRSLNNNFCTTENKINHVNTHKNNKISTHAQAFVYYDNSST